MEERVRTGQAGGCGGGAGGDLGARPVLHLDQNLGWTHPGQLTDALVPQPDLSCHMTHVRECAAGELRRRGAAASLTGRVAEALPAVKRHVPEAAPVLVPAAAKVHAAVQTALDQEPAWEDRRSVRTSSFASLEATPLGRSLASSPPF